MIETLFTTKDRTRLKSLETGQNIQLYIHAAVGTAAGILFGMGFAVNSLLAGSLTGPQRVDWAAISVDEPSATVARHSLDRLAVQGETVAVPAPAAPVAPIAQSASVALVSVTSGNDAAVQAHSIPKTPVAHGAVSSLRHVPASGAPAISAPSVQREEMNPEIATEYLGFAIEGDTTVVDYDASVGIITTSGSETFVVGAAASESSVIHWQDYPVNVHYRCNRVADCTLVHAGKVVSHVRLGIQSDRSREGDVAMLSDAPTPDLQPVPQDFSRDFSRGSR